MMPKIGNRQPVQWINGLSRSLPRTRPIYRQLVTLLEDGIARGELRTDLDCDAVLDAIYGPLYYRFLVTHQPMSSRYADTVLDHIWPAITAQPIRRAARNTKQSDGRAGSVTLRAKRQTR